MSDEELVEDVIEPIEVFGQIQQLPIRVRHQPSNPVASMRWSAKASLKIPGFRFVVRQGFGSQRKEAIDSVVRLVTERLERWPDATK